MWSGRRQFVKQTLSFTKVKLLYARITLTRFTILYFFLAAITCVVLSALQAVTFTDNSKAVSVISSNVVDGPKNGLVTLEKGSLRLCSGIPGQPGTKCTVELSFGDNLQSRNVFDFDNWVRDNSADNEDDIDTQSDAVFTSGGPLLADNCVFSLRWLDETIHDAQREDVVTFVFQIWLFILALVAILNESIPHLVASLLGHMLGSAWAGYRVKSMEKLKDLYKNQIVPEACGGTDILGDWWDIRIQHAIPIVVVNGVTLLAFCYVSYKLFNVYANESFSRVGASPKIHRIYKLVLLFSVFLQLSGFFSLASTAMWIDKVCSGDVLQMPKHAKLYLAAFITTLLLEFPWFFLGWTGVRRECKVRFGVFCGISVFLLAISTAMFTSPLYRYVFVTWPLFATMTVTSYVLLIVTTVKSIVCRLNFGQGLAHYLQVTDALEGLDFTPVYFPKDDEKDPEKYASIADLKTSKAIRPTQITLQLPAASFQDLRKGRGSSIYSETGSPIFFSSSPPLVSELSPAPKRLSKASQKRNTSVPYPPLKTIGDRNEEKAAKHPFRRSQTTPTRDSAAISTSGSSPTAPSGASTLSISPISSIDGANGPPRRKKHGLPVNPRYGMSPGIAF
ncbi:hypothetical protein BDZ97DRAFT_1190460 [Flammula alnicola]|nr:hypothetical protein BDZ97DRAFT_1190460 [Flammula alnicola]